MKWTLVAVFTLAILILASQPVISEPSIKDLNVTPRIADTETEFVFTVTYVGDSAPEEIVVMIGDTPYPMQELHPDDSNYSDGKIYYLNTKLDKGTYVCYFNVEEGDTTLRSGAYTLVVDSGFGFEHMDIVLAVGIMGGIFMIPIIFLTVYLKRTSRQLVELLKQRESAQDSQTSEGFEDQVDVENEDSVDEPDN